MNPIDSTIVGTYDYPVVVLAVCISVLASFTALDLAERVNGASGLARRAWLISGGVVLGIGIWSMHFTAMLAFRLPLSVQYHWPTALISLLEGIVASIIALCIVTLKNFGWRAALRGSLLQGSGIAGLHYTGMEAMRMQAMCSYSPPIVMLSVAVAIAVSLMSIRLTFLLRNEPSHWKLRKAASALLMGAAISTMHFTGMAATSFMAVPMAPDLSRTVRITSLGIAGIVAVSVIVLYGTLVTAFVDRLQEKRAQLDKLFEKSQKAVAVMEANGRVLRVNPEFTRVFGFTPKEAAERQLGELIAPGELGLDLRNNGELAPEGLRTETEIVRQRKDGTRLNVLAVSSPVSLHGRRTEVWASYRDVTARKNAAKALQEMSRRLLDVQEAERRYLAGELHDEVGQLLTGLRLLLKLNEEDSIDAMKSRFYQAGSIVDDLLATVRRLSFDLRPADLDQFGLLPAILGLIERYTAQTGILVDFKHRDIDRRFSPQLETAAYRILQEALTNTARHASVAGVSVRLWIEDRSLNLEVEDRGLGFDPDTVMKVARSSGLCGMSERVSLVGGQITIDSAPGVGTTISIGLPLNDPGVS